MLTYDDAVDPPTPCCPQCGEEEDDSRPCPCVEAEDAAFEAAQAESETRWSTE